MAAKDLPLPSHFELFISFAGVSFMGFGGVMPWAHWMAVEKRGWLTQQQFNSTTALCQTLPGANVLNFAVITGRRFKGATGALVSVVGLLLAPFFIVIGLAAFYAAYKNAPGIADALKGVGAAGGGLVAAMAAKMARELDGGWIAYAAAAAAFVAVGVLRAPLVLTVLVLVPLLVAWFWKRV